MAPPRILVLSSLLWMHVSSPRVFSFHIFQYFHKYSTVKSTLLDFCPIDHFLWILRLVNRNIHWEKVCIEKSEPLHRSLNLFAENWWVVGGLESSSFNGRGLDYIAFYIRFLLRTKTRLFDDDASLNEGHYFCMSSVLGDGEPSQWRKYHWNKNGLASSHASHDEKLLNEQKYILCRFKMFPRENIIWLE